MVDETNNLAKEIKSELKSATDKMEASNADRLKEDKAALEAGLAKVEGQSKDLEAKSADLEVKAKAMDIAIERFNTIGTSEEKAEDTAAVEYKNAMATFMRTGNDVELKELSEGVDPEGGYTVSTITSSFIVSRTFETSPMRRVARSETISGPVLEMLIDDDELEALSAAEKEARGITDSPEFGLKRISLHENFAQPRATQMILDDSNLDIESWIAGKASSKIARKENTAFIRGNGVSESRGILSYAAWTVNGTYQRDAIERINTGVDGTFTVDGLIDIQNSLKEEYQANAVWFIKRSNWGAIMKLKGTSNFHFLGLQPTDRATNTMGATMEMLGRPVIFADDLDTADGITAGLEGALYGDFGVGYTVVDHSKGMRVLRDNLTQKPFTLFYTTKRVGGDVTNFEAIKVQLLSA